MSSFFLDQSAILDMSLILCDYTNTLSNVSIGDINSIVYFFRLPIIPPF